MSFTDMIKNSVLEGFSSTDFSTSQIAAVLIEAFIVSLYIFFVYRILTRSSFYNRGYAVSMSIISVVTAGIVLAMQSNLVISLGMVGALSIVRFRTAIKEPMDLLFLFWSIGTGIVVGAGLLKLAIVMALVVTIGIAVLMIIPAMGSPEILVLKLSDKAAEQPAMDLIKQYSKKYKVDSKSINKLGTTMVIQITSKQGSELVDKISEIEGVSLATLMHHEGEVKN